MSVIAVYLFAAQQQPNTYKRQNSPSIDSKFSLEDNKLASKIHWKLHKNWKN